MATYKTTKEIVIPVGTVLDAPPAHSTRWERDYDVPIALGKDHVGYFSVDPSEGVESGWLEKML